MKRLATASLALVIVVSVIVASQFITSPSADGAPAGPAQRHRIHMAAVEPRGGTSITSEAFPTTTLPSGSGYVLRPPDATGRWEISAYYWQPGFIVANEGDDVTLEILGINGAEHPTTIEGHDVPGFTVRRGQISVVSFRARRPGTYRIVCDAHLPTMVGHLVVLPRR